MTAELQADVDALNCQQLLAAQKSVGKSYRSWQRLQSNLSTIQVIHNSWMPLLPRPS